MFYCIIHTVCIRVHLLSLTLCMKVNLRILSNVVYFVGRALAGEDSLDSLITRADTYATRVRDPIHRSQLIRSSLFYALLYALLYAL